MMFNVQAYALELLMFHNKYCGYCNKFMKEVAPEYNIESLPLKIIDAYNQPGWFKLAKEEGRVQPIIGTPTFIIFDEYKLEEVNRITGYSGVEWFYTSLKEKLEEGQKLYEKKENDN